MKQKLSHIIILCLACCIAYGQKPKFYASTDARKIVEGSYLQVKFVLENGDGTGFKPPNFEDFNVVSGPSSSSSTSIINGVVSKEIAYTYGLQPKGIGNKKITEASIKVNGQTLTSQTIPIEVVKGSTKAIAADQQYFVKTVLTDTTTYVGQQILLTYKLYTTVDIRSVNFNTTPSFDGFYTEELRLARQEYKREIVNGVEYFTKPLGRFAIFPQQTGTYEINPVSIRLGIATNKSSRSIFFTSQLLQKNVMAEGAKVYVNGLPAAGQNYSGAVGRYKMDINISKRSLTTDEAITVIMRITGNGDNKTVNAPKWKLPEGLEMYDPNILEDEVFPSVDGLTHRKSFEYLIVAKEPGKYNLTPQFEYFNVDSSKFITLHKNLPKITVVKGNNSDSVITEREAQELSGIYSNSKFKKIKNNHSANYLQFLALLLALLGGIMVLLYSKRLKQSGKFDPNLIRKEKAYGIALKRLENSKVYLDEANSKAFHEEIIIALKTYLTDKYNIPALHINRTELMSQLNAIEAVPNPTLKSLDAILEESEIAMYAPSTNSNLKNSYESAINLIVALEK